MAELDLARRNEEDPTKNHGERAYEVHNFAISQGMPKWLAKIVFRERIEVIWVSGAEALQPA